MKADRKELETNVLAQKLGEVYEGLRQGPSRSTIVWLTVIAGVALVGGLFWWFYTSSRANDSQRWVRIDGVVFPAQLESLLEDGNKSDSELRGTTQLRVARFKGARMMLSSGLRSQGSNPELAKKRLDEARQLYEELAKESGRVPVLHQEALAGAARANEALGNYAEAKSWFEKLAAQYPSTPFGEDASRQIKRLDGAANQDDLDKLKQMNQAGWQGQSFP